MDESFNPSPWRTQMCDLKYEKVAVAELFADSGKLGGRFVVSLSANRRHLRCNVCVQSRRPGLDDLVNKGGVFRFPALISVVCLPSGTSLRGFSLSAPL